MVGAEGCDGEGASGRSTALQGRGDEFGQFAAGSDKKKKFNCIIPVLQIFDLLIYLFICICTGCTKNLYSN